MNDAAAATPARPVPAPPPPQLAPLLNPTTTTTEDDDYDAWVLAGGRLFRAHASVLASHSAYLRGVAVGGGVTGARGDVRLLLPHVPPTGFAAILTYMYTGRLPVTPATLYEVLLAGHLLQMAGVVSLCQALLTTTTTTTATDGGALGVTPDLPTLPPALSVWRGLARLVPPPPLASHHQATVAPSSSTISLPGTIVRPTPTRARPLHPPLDLTREPEAMETETSGGDDRKTTTLHHHPTTTTTTSPPTMPSHLSNHHHLHHSFGEPGQREESKGGRGGGGVGGAVVLDVATCDGPVFFERVINRAYKANPLLGPDDSETETEINVEEVDSSEDTTCRPPPASHSTGEGDRGREGLATLLQIPPSGSKGESKAESKQTSIPCSSSPPMPNNTLSRTYHCVYCNHTFKSHYCYQKHMRRHINPITVEVDKARPANTLPTTTTATTTNINTSPNSEGEGNSGVVTSGGGGGAGGGSTKSGSNSPYSSHTVSPAPSSEGLKILDLNVQYFPCKTCGSKFPSYYFVHKHRRLCHQDEENTTSATPTASAHYVKKSAPQSSSTPPLSTATTPTPTTPAPPPTTPTAAAAAAVVAPPPPPPPPIIPPATTTVA